MLTLVMLNCQICITASYVLTVTRTSKFKSHIQMDPYSVNTKH